MSDGDTYTSSDDARTGALSPHVQRFEIDQPVSLTRGGTLPAVTVAYETFGTLNTARDNAVLICHALSGDSHVARHDEGDLAGWWDTAVGPGKAIDTDRYFVICANNLGGCCGTTGPSSIDPRTGKRYGPDFPVITIEDIVDVESQLVDHLGIHRLHAVVGGSLGGLRVLVWATRFPHRVAACAPIATGTYLTSQATAFDVIGRNAIRQDPNYHGGDYYDKPIGPDTGLALARMLGHITYLSPQAMSDKFDVDKHSPRDIATAFEKQFSVGSYLAHQGSKFVQRFDANSYVTLSMAMDLFEMGRSPVEIRDQLARSTCRWLVMSFSSDWLFPPSQSREITDALIASGKRVSYCNITTDCGHDAFLLPDNIEMYGGLLEAFLADVQPAETIGKVHPIEEQRVGIDPRSIFHEKRIDYESILDLIEPGTSVLDLGCGRGSLLARLAARGHARLMGVELDELAILTCVRRGLDVVHADLNEGLSHFENRQFDYVLVSQTLQTVVHTDAFVAEILRVGWRCVVTFPNFGYHKVRKAVGEDGRSPVSEGGVLHYAWYNTPNRRFLSVLDWRDFCADRGIRIEAETFLDTEVGERVTDDPNRNADLAISVISR